MKITVDMLKETSGSEYRDILDEIKAKKIKNVYELCERIRKSEVWKKWEFGLTRKKHDKKNI